MEALDVGALAGLARRHGVMTMIDNSWATPVFQKPVSLGVDLVIHSASKYIGGHSDTVAGVVAGRADLIRHIRQTICPYIGAKLAPFEAWLLLRGLAHPADPAAAARGLGRDPGAPPRRGPSVTSVHHPALAPRCRPASRGPAGCSPSCSTSIDIPAFCDALTLFQLGVSWGGHESLVVPALVTRVQAAGPNSAVDFGVPERMVRLHVGLEGTEALWADLAQALAAARR